jgi:hypothetical protein
MIADLVAAGTQVPGLGDQLDARQRRILQQRIEEAGARIVAVVSRPSVTLRSKRKPST